jgi:hypothetical protein
MHVRPVDSRDTRSEIDEPVFRVYFWRDLGTPPDGAGRAYASDEYEVTDADVREVIYWADEESAGRTYTLHVLVPDLRSEELGLINLAGVDPTRP